MSDTQKHQVNHKPFIIMQPGPIHLFWTTSIFYLWSLKERFDFVLIVPPSYRDSILFSKVAGLEAIRHVECLPAKGNLLCQYRYNQRFQTLLRQYQPAYLLLHNRSYLENQYLIHWALKICPETPRYYYQNGRMSLRWQEVINILRASGTGALINRIPLLRQYPKVAGKIVDLKNALNFLINYKCLPWLVIQESFSPPMNVLSGRIDREAVRRSNTEKDFLLAYLDIEIDAYRSKGIDNIIPIRHPLADSGLQVFKFLYGDVVESNTILLLPSNGYTSRMIEAGWLQTDIVRCIANKWCEAIVKLLESFPGYALRMKLHPASYADPIWLAIIKQIQSRFSVLTIIDPKQSAEWHVVQSKVIVGDVSSILWWAAMFGGKVVLSLDIFGYPAGDELKGYYKYIHYLNSLDDIPTLPVDDSLTHFASNLCEVIL